MEIMHSWCWDGRRNDDLVRRIPVRKAYAALFEQIDGASSDMAL